MPTLTANGIEIGYEVHGNGRPLVLIAGLGYSRWMWQRMVPGLAAHFQVVAFDNRGVGESGKPPGPYTAAMLAADTAVLMETLGLENAVVMGHSMGGFVAQALALARPDLVGALALSATNFGGPNHIPVTPAALAVLLDTSADPVTRFKNGLGVSTAPGFPEKHPEIIKEWLAWRVANPIEPAPYQAQLAIGLALAQTGFEDRLTAVACPTLLLFGEHDQVAPPGNADLLAAKIPNSAIKIIPDAGHFFPMETPNAAVTAVVAFAVD
ncbi:MAG: alpha/beta fold hydrolase [Anaerolineae bacterium]